jgi:hypothetical protein
MVSPVPTQRMIVDCEFSRGGLDRCACRQQTLDPHTLQMIAALTAAGSRTFWLCHLYPHYAPNIKFYYSAQ